jgi:hypothetical protein
MLKSMKVIFGHGALELHSKSTTECNVSKYVIFVENSRLVEYGNGNSTGTIGQGPCPVLVRDIAELIKARSIACRSIIVLYNLDCGLHLIKYDRRDGYVSERAITATSTRRWGAMSSTVPGFHVCLIIWILSIN